MSLRKRTAMFFTLLFSSVGTVIWAMFAYPDSAPWYIWVVASISAAIVITCMMFSPLIFEDD